MQSHARQVFESFVAEARSAGARELRLVSGRMPVLVIETQTRTIGWNELSAALVRDIHLVCLTMAKQETAPDGATFAYRIASNLMGSARCNYRIRARIRSLSLIFEGGAPEVAESVPQGTLPTPSAEALSDDRDE